MKCGRTKGWDVRKLMDKKIGHKGESPKLMRIP